MDAGMFLLLLAVASIKLGQGFEFDRKAVFVPKNKAGILRGILASVFLVPVLFALLILVFQPPIQIVAALIVMSVCPAADLSIQQVEKLGGDVPLATGVQVISAIISILTIPIFLKLFQLFFGSRVDVKFLHIVREIAVAQFLPMLFGISLRRFFPTYSWLARFIIKAATVLLLLCFIYLFIKNSNEFLEFKLQAYVMVIFATVMAFILGRIFAGENIKKQVSLSIESSLRNPGLAFLIAEKNFPIERVHSAMVPYIFTTVLTVVISVFFLKKIQQSFEES